MGDPRRIYLNWVFGGPEGDPNLCYVFFSRLLLCFRLASRDRDRDNDSSLY